MRFCPRLLAAAWAVGILAVGVSRPAAQSGDSYLRVSFIDVGQGDAIWIQGPDEDDGTPGGNLIIDGGPDRGLKNRLVKYLRAQSYGLQLALKERADGRRSRFVELRQTTDRELRCGNLSARIIHADSASLADMGSGNTRENNASTVIQLKFGAFTFLFMGDAEGKERGDSEETTEFVEELLLQKAAGEPDLLRADVLKVGHHGSETGSSLKFIRAVQPSVIVIMSGRKRYSGTFLPDQAVLARYRRENPRLVVLRTDEDDARQRRDTTNDQDGDDVYMYTDGESLRVFKAVGASGRRVWRRVTSIQKDAA